MERQRRHQVKIPNPHPDDKSCLFQLIQLPRKQQSSSFTVIYFKQFYSKLHATFKKYTQ